jgi:TolA-binding protein
LQQALNALRDSQRLDSLSGEATRRAMYWIGTCYEMQGDQVEAMAEFDRVGKLFGDTAESLVATLAKADLHRKTGNMSLALASYRSVLESVGDPVTYYNPLLSLDELKKRLIGAQTGFIATDEFEAALALLEQYPLLFSQVEVIQMRAKTHEQWGLDLLKQAADQTRRRAGSIAKEGRYHLRAAGRAYESLAHARFATRKFSDDLWLAAEYYYRGQNYTHAARVLEEYLHYEAERRNAAALLRLGQCLLTIDKTEIAIQALEQCIEMYPRDVAVYQARLECVRAYLLLNREPEAEQLLLTNLTGDSLTPESPEWRDSLFALGQLLHDKERYREAILKLEEAVIRYPNAPQALMARYTIARSFHSAAEVPAQNVLEAKTENERQKNRKLRDQNLEGALDNYLLVQRMITLEGHGQNSLLRRSLLRNCYMMQGSVLFQLRRYEESRKAYANVSTLYQNEPFVLESFVHIANCWRRLNQPIKARGTIEQAKLVLQRLPPDTDFRVATNFDRQYWHIMLMEMSKW